MKSKFKDTEEGWKQEYIFVTLLSLAKASDAYQFAQGLEGMAKQNAREEVRFHYGMAIRTLLRMLALDRSVGQTVVTLENLKLLADHGVKGMQEFIDRYEEFLLFEDEDSM